MKKSPMLFLFSTFQFIKLLTICFGAFIIASSTHVVDSSMTISSSSTMSIRIREASSLLKWKSNLEIESQTLLSSWTGNNSCNWLGITCDEDYKFVSNINLTNMGY
ncbi:unnamed protein product [Trifolium pratense]|uniref:Uncharacterized protein n=1 Tax=Trifolium pratense TaxID=57577 RepID=A0ACB0LKR5_TRIPR|nr:unnamed protein product [Trifolium pratense]